MQSDRMYRRLATLTLPAVVAAGLLAACTPVTSTQGYQVIDERPGDVKVGVDTLQTVRTRFGSPTAISTFEPNVWYYISQVNDSFGFYRPRVRDRAVVQITFDKTTQKVADMTTYTAKDGKVIAYNSRETPTRGRELSVIQQILGTVGTQALPNEDDDPGNPGGGRNGRGR
ncbi:hypothetical protein BH11PSE2_BH11PSE2_04160 [soil metagenome]